MATETVVQTDGLIDALARILRQLIRTPKFKEAAIVLLNSIDPPAARELVRVLFWEDTGLFLSIVGAVPSLINTGIELVAEMAAQMNSMPAPLLREFVDRLVAGIDGAAAGEAAGGLVSMVLSLEDASKAMKGNPEFVEHVLKPLLSPVLQTGAKKPGAKKPGAKKPGGKK
jgi:hypothetical protein